MGASDLAPPDSTPAETGSCDADIDCIDENPCTADFCEAGECVHLPDNQRTPVPIEGNCRREFCQDGVLLLEPDNEDLPEDDGVSCTITSCTQGEVVIVPDHASCNDNDRCNGVEVCDRFLGCSPGTPPDFDNDGVPDDVDPTTPDVDDDDIPDCADWETCDGLDNDANGLVDDNPQDEELGQVCYDGAAATDGVGTCQPGMVACFQSRLTCLEQVLPAEDELCDGLDNDCDGSIPSDEINAFCRTQIAFPADDPGPELMRLEFLTKLRTVDIHFNLDTTGSMAGALNAVRNTLRSDIVPGVAEVIPEVAFGVSTFEDFPLHNFGSGDDLPFELWQRITTDLDLVQGALAEISLGSGNDIPESGMESLYQIATGAGARWPRGGASSVLDPANKRGFVAEIDPPGDVDFYRLDIPEGTFVSVDLDASRVGSSLDALIQLFDATGRLLAYSDDLDGLDPGLGITVNGTAPFFLSVEGESASTTGWYYVQVIVSGIALVPAGGACSALEVGGDFFAGLGDAVRLEGFDSVTPRLDPIGCFEDCQATLADPRTASWIRSHCFAGGTDFCGNGSLDEYEECDDNNRSNGDGCSLTCSLETAGVPPFNPEAGYDPGLGHGNRGGAGFRERALPIVVHITDAVSHDQEDYISRDPGIMAHSADETFIELEKLGARVVGIASRDPARAPLTDLHSPPGMAFTTGAIVPTCAFDGSEPRDRDTGNVCNNNNECYSRECVSGLCAPLCAADECCVGPDGEGQAPLQGADGQCVLSFEMEGDGSGVTDGVIRGIQALARFATYRVSPVLRDDPNNRRDARCFVQDIQVIDVVRPEGCGPEPVLVDLDEDGSFESIANLTPQSRVMYELEVANRDTQDFDGDLDSFEACGPPGTYVLDLDLVGDDLVVLASTRLTFTIEE